MPQTTGRNSKKAAPKPAIGVETPDGATVATPQGVDLTDREIHDILTKLNVNVPYYAIRLVGDRLEFYLYGGRVVYYPRYPEGRITA
jgi:hypothetical protein